MNPDDPNYVPPVTTDEPEVPEVPVVPEPESPEAPETPESPEEPEAPQTVEQLQAANKKLFERAKKAEAALKANKGQSQPKPKAPTEPGVEETVLRANGMPDELLTQLKKVAVLNNTTLLKAQTDPIYLAVKEKFDKEQKHKQAGLGAGRGAGGKKPEKSTRTPGLSRDEHREMVQAKLRGQ